MPLIEQIFITSPGPDFYSSHEAPAANPIGYAFLTLIVFEVVTILILDIKVDRKRKRKRKELNKQMKSTEMEHGF